jgi:hypothetical protein
VDEEDIESVSAAIDRETLTPLKEGAEEDPDPADLTVPIAEAERETTVLAEREEALIRPETSTQTEVDLQTQETPEVETQEEAETAEGAEIEKSVETEDLRVAITKTGDREVMM